MTKKATFDRRSFMASAGAGLLAAGGLHGRLALAAELFDGHPLAPRSSHFPPRAERLIVVFLTGGYSQVDTFDPKPKLTAIMVSHTTAAFCSAPLFRSSRAGSQG